MVFQNFSFLHHLKRQFLNTTIALFYIAQYITKGLIIAEKLRQSLSERLKAILQKPNQMQLVLQMWTSETSVG